MPVKNSEREKPPASSTRYSAQAYPAAGDATAVSATVADAMTPEARSTALKPYAAKMRAATNFIDIAPMALTKVIMPLSKGDRP